MTRPVLLFAFASGVHGSTEQVNPLGQVLTMMDDLAAKVTKEGEVEQAAYEEYFAWCDDVNKNSHFAIKTATSQKEKLEAQISELTANIEEGASNIEDLAASISAAEDELAKATSVREKEAADFAASEAELVESVDTLGRAINIISREMQKNPALLQQANSGDLGTLLKSLSAVVDAAAFSVDDQKHLMALVQAKQGSSS